MNPLNELQKKARAEFDKELSASACRGINYDFIEPRIREFLNTLIEKVITATLESVREKMPGTGNECQCEDYAPGYHTKDCTFYPQGWNAYRTALLAVLKEMEV